jgi:hypothetical protein
VVLTSLANVEGVKIRKTTIKAKQIEEGRKYRLEFGNKE